MSSSYDQWTRLTMSEKLYLATNPLHALIIKDSKDTAYNETKKRFGKNGRNDRSDAFRHCFWSAILSRDIGYMNAFMFTTAHESRPDNDPKEKEMDLHNNKVGLEIGRQFFYVTTAFGRLFSSDNEISNKCFAALQAGKLKVM